MHPSYTVFQQDSGAKEKVTEQGCKTANSGCICRFELEFCKNKKERAETLYQSFSPFMWNDSRNDTIHSFHFALGLSFYIGCIWVQKSVLGCKTGSVGATPGFRFAICSGKLHSKQN